MKKINYLWLSVFVAAFFVPLNAQAALTGTGAELDPYIIDECTDFGEMADTSAYYEMTTDLNCGGVDIEPLFSGGTFTGEFDGGGFTVTDVDIVIADAGDYASNGLFASINGATIRNWTLDDVTITVPDGDQVIGTLAGRANGDNLIDTVAVVNGDVNSGGGYIVAGLIGEASDATGITTMNNSSFTGTIDLTPTAATVQNLGGLFGTAGSVVLTDSFADITLTINGENGALDIGGIAGSCYSCDFSGVYSTGLIINGSNLSDVAHLGGLIGKSNDDLIITDAYSDIEISINAFAAMTDADTIGGLFGELNNDFDISESYFIGSIDIGAGAGSFVGGLAGTAHIDNSVDAEAFIDQVYVSTTMIVDNVDTIAGFIPYVAVEEGELNVTNSFATGSIYASNSDYIGGMLGIVADAADVAGNWLTMENVFSDMDLILTDAVDVEAVAGLVLSLFSFGSDNAQSTISNVFVTGVMYGDYGIGGAIFGLTNGSLTLTDAYYDKSLVDGAAVSSLQFDYACTSLGDIDGCQAVNDNFSEPDRLYSPAAAPIDNFDTETIWTLSESFEDADENLVYTNFPHLTNLPNPFYPRPTYTMNALIDGEEIAGQTINENQPTFTFSVDGPDDYSGFGYGIIISTADYLDPNGFVVVYGDYEYPDGITDFSFTVGDSEEYDGEEPVKAYTETEEDGVFWGEEGMELENGEYYVYLIALGGTMGDPGTSNYLMPTAGEVSFVVDAVEVEEEVSGGGGSSSGSSKSKVSSDDQAELSDYEKELQEVRDRGLVEKEMEKETDKCEALMIMARSLGWEYDNEVTEDGFSDTPEWCKPIAKYASDMGYIEGRSEGILGLDTPMNRFEFVQILFRVLEGEPVSTVAPYTDEIMDWAKNSVNWAHAKGYMTGFADGTFGGEKGILKQDVGVVMLRLMQSN